MSKSWHQLKNIRDFITECKAETMLYREDLSKQDKELLASHILSLTFADDFSKKWIHEYPILDRIEALSSDLEWSNAYDVDEDWRGLIDYIDELDAQVNKKP